jgi:hypothetical protein
MTSERLCKLPSHDLVVLIHEIHWPRDLKLLLGVISLTFLVRRCKTTEPAGERGSGFDVGEI